MAGLLAWLFRTTGQARKRAAHLETTSAEGLARHLYDHSGHLIPEYSYCYQANQNQSDYFPAIHTSMIFGILLIPSSLMLM